MVNKIRSAIGGLAMLASSALAVPAVTNTPSYLANASIKSTRDISIENLSLPIEMASSIVQVPSFSSIGFISTNNTNQVELKGNIYEGDFSSYRVQSCSNLVENVWQDSATNTNLCSKTGRGKEFIAAEPYTSNKMNYRMRQN